MPHIRPIYDRWLLKVNIIVSNGHLPCFRRRKQKNEQPMPPPSDCPPPYDSVWYQPSSGDMSYYPPAVNNPLYFHSSSSVNGGAANPAPPVYESLSGRDSSVYTKLDADRSDYERLSEVEYEGSVYSKLSTPNSDIGSDQLNKLKNDEYMEIL